MGPQAAVLLAFLTGCISLLFGILNFGDKTFNQQNQINVNFI
jgi:hypothetical protein